MFVILFCSDTQSCMHYVSYWKGNNHIVFMGNARMKDLFHEFVALVDNDSGEELTPEDDHAITKKSNMYTNQTRENLSGHYEKMSIGLYAVSNKPTPNV